MITISALNRVAEFSQCQDRDLRVRVRAAQLADLFGAEAPREPHDG